MQPPAHQPLVRTLARSLTRRCGVGEGDRLLVAVSGGRDSVALLRGLAALAERRQWRLSLAVGHVDHHLRPGSSDDAAFVAELAAALGLPCYQRDVHPADEGTERANVEATARRLRYAALGEMAGRFGAHFVVTAHQADDQLETLLMRLMRGSGVAGLRGIAWRRRLPTAERSQTDSNEADPGGNEFAVSEPILIRPMLATDRAEARRFVEAIGQSWRDDPTNDDRDRWRARLRAEVLPVLRDMQGDVARKAVRAADHFRELHAMTRQAARDCRREAVREAMDGAVADEQACVMVARDAARRMPRIVLTALLRDLLTEAGAPRDRLTRRTLTPIARAMRDDAGGERRFDLPGGVCVVLDRDGLYLPRAYALATARDDG